MISPSAADLVGLLSLPRGSSAGLTKEAHIYAVLREAIATGDLSPRVHLRVAEIADAFGVSPIPVRAAFRMLEAEGLVEVRAHVGTFVTELPYREILEALEVRTALEVEASTAAIDKATEQVVANLTMFCDEMDELAASGDSASYAALNNKFHRAIYELSDNKVLIETLHALEFRCSRGMATFHSRGSRMQRSNAEHRRIVAALANRNLLALQQETRLHRRESATTLTTMRDR